MKIMKAYLENIKPYDSEINEDEARDYAHNELDRQMEESEDKYLEHLQENFGSGLI